ncbi:MAG: cupin domain-containing protein [Christensenellales bacterium]|jgi:mannose-6-phosphate isomerase-like protein (cupin superfamily)
MVIKNAELPREERQNMRGGKGCARLMHLCPAQDLPPNCRLASVITLEKGASIGTHDHVGESEFYYILSGRGETVENGRTIPLLPGDVTLTGKGNAHDISNTGDEELVLLAVVITE